MIGQDKEGRPCIVVKGCRHVPEESDEEEMMRFFVYHLEKACAIADEYINISNNLRTDKKQVVVIVDRENMGLANFDRRFMGKRGLISVLQDFYAERLHKIYVLHINWVFRMIFSMVRPFLSARTVEKIKICAETSDLWEYFDKEFLLKEHGGVLIEP
jgi:hypothetical protein